MLRTEKVGERESRGLSESNKILRKRLMWLGSAFVAAGTGAFIFYIAGIPVLAGILAGTVGAGVAKGLGQLIAMGSLGLLPVGAFFVALRQALSLGNEITQLKNS